MKKQGIIFNLLLTILGLIQVAFMDLQDPILLKYEVLVIDVYIILVGYYYLKNIMHPYMMLCFMINLFLCSRIWLDVFFDGIPYYYTTFFSNYPFIDNVQRIICLMLILTFLGLNLSLVFLKGNDNSSRKNIVIELKENRRAIYYSKIIMYICVIPVMYMIYETYQYVQSYGYTALYINSQTGRDTGSGMLKHIAMLFQISFFVFLASKPNRNEFIKISALFIFVNILTLLTGGRGGFATLMGTYLTYVSIYRRRISLKFIVILGFVSIFLFQFASMYRDVASKNNNVDTSVDIVQPFFAGQGVSITVLGYATQIESNGALDIAYPIMAYFDEKFNDEYAKNKDKYNYAYRLSSSINPDMYSHGMGTGSSFIAESYSAGGLLFVFIVAVCLGSFTIKSINMFGNKFLGVIGLLIFWQALYFMPRSSLLGWLIPAVKWIIMLYIIRYCDSKIRIGGLK